MLSNTRHRRNPTMAGGFGFRGGEQTPLTFIEMRQHRRLALLERIFVNHPQRYDAAHSPGIPYLFP